MKLIILYDVDTDERIYINADMVQSIKSGLHVNGKETSVINLNGQRVTVLGSDHVIASIVAAEEEEGKFNDYKDWDYTEE